jgi:hypothetical protein
MTSDPRAFSRARRGLLVALPVLLLPGRLLADEEVAVPVPLQMELLLKVAGYDKHLPARAASAARVLILIKAGSPQASQVAQTARLALQGKTLNRLAVEVLELSYGEPGAVAQAVKDKRVAIVDATPGFNPNELSNVARVLRGLSVLSVGALSRFVETGVVLGFDLVGGKPKLVVHLRRAREQSVELSSQVLKLAKVIE